jgi:hypothetical protein
MRYGIVILWYQQSANMIIFYVFFSTNYFACDQQYHLCKYLQMLRMFECFETNWLWTSLMISNFNWSNFDTHNFFLKNKIFSINSNFFKSISSKNFFLFRIASRIVIHVVSFWFVNLTLSNNDNSEFSSSMSLNFCKIRESTFSNDKTIWCICLFRSFNSSIDRSSTRLISEFVLLFLFFWLINYLEIELDQKFCSFRLTFIQFLRDHEILQTFVIN